MLVHDLAEIIDGGLVIRKASGRITGRAPSRSTRTVRDISDSAITDGIERQVDIARTQPPNITDLRRVGLIEQVEEPSPELKLFRLAEVKVLEERDIEVASARSPYIKRRLRWSAVGEGWNLKST